MQARVFVLVVATASMIWTTSAWAERLRARDGTIRDVPEESVDFALKDGYQRLPTVFMRDRSGSVREVYEDMAKDAEEQEGWWRMTPSEVAAYRSKQLDERLARIGREVRAETYGGVGGTAKACILGFLRGATVGLSNAIWRWSSGEQATIDIEAMSDENPKIWAVSTVVGVLGMFLMLVYIWRRSRRPRDPAAEEWRAKLRDL
jgi:hypothetical protein